jgi:phage pi2 protein 07
MTNAEYFNRITGMQEEAHMQAFKATLVNMQDMYPEINFERWLPSYRNMIDWLNAEKPANTKEVGKR